MVTSKQTGWHRSHIKQFNLFQSAPQLLIKATLLASRTVETAHQAHESLTLSRGVPTQCDCHIAKIAQAVE